MKNQVNGIAEYSSSPTGQGCLWIVAVGIVGVLGFSYLSTYAGFPHDPLDHVENGIAGVSRPVSGRRAVGVRYHRRPRRHRLAEMDRR